MAKNSALDDLARYEYGRLAYRFTDSEETQPFIGETLLKLADKLGVEDTGSDLLKSIVKSGEGIKPALETYNEKYENALCSLNVSELSNFYKPRMEDYLGARSGEYKKVEAELNKFASDKYGDIANKFEKAKTILKSKKGLFSDTDIKSAEQNILKYNKIYAIIQMLENIKFGELRPSVVRNAYKENFKDLARKI